MREFSLVDTPAIRIYHMGMKAAASTDLRGLADVRRVVPSARLLCELSVMDCRTFGCLQPRSQALKVLERAGLIACAARLSVAVSASSETVAKPTPVGALPGHGKGFHRLDGFWQR